MHLPKETADRVFLIIILSDFYQCRSQPPASCGQTVWGNELWSWLQAALFVPGLDFSKARDASIQLCHPDFILLLSNLA